ncbi:MAG: hypothetical protein ACRC6V_14410 [Bacteroidales bacterium]
MRSSLSGVEKAILFHKHEANRSRFFGLRKEEEYHSHMVQMITRMKTYSEKTKDEYANSLWKRLEGRV